jgi:hypothetical protein
MTAGYRSGDFIGRPGSGVGDGEAESAVEAAQCDGHYGLPDDPAPALHRGLAGRGVGGHTLKHGDLTLLASGHPTGILAS